MTNEELINILMELPLECDVEHCRPLIEGNVIKFRAGCDQSHCTLMKLDEFKLNKTRSTVMIMKGAIASKGSAKDTPEHMKKFLRGLYGLLNELEAHLAKSELP